MAVSRRFFVLLDFISDVIVIWKDGKLLLVRFSIHWYTLLVCCLYQSSKGETL